MSTTPRVKITHEIPGDEVTYRLLAEVRNVEISITVEFDHGEHDHAALVFDRAATEILEQLAALGCPCLPGAPAHAHGRGGYAPAVTVEPCTSTTTVRSQEGEHDHPRLREYVGRVVACTGAHHTPDRIHSVLLDPAGPWYAWPMTEPPAPMPDNCVHEWRPFITVEGERMKCLKCGTRPAGSRP